ncbi:MAG: TPM domain-containing protein [Bacillota bacterium]
MMLNLRFRGTTTGLIRKNRARLAGTAVLALAIIVSAGSLAYPASLYPEPNGNINDYVGVLTQSDIDGLNALVDAVLEQTGVTFAVAIVSEHGDESIEMYGVNLYEKWGIGQENEDKGLLVILSMEERELRMEVGYGLEPVITDGRAGECLDMMIPYFRNEEYGKGLYAGLLNAAEYIAQDAGIELQIKEHGGYWPLVPGDGYVQPGIPTGMVLLVAGIILLPVALLAYQGIKRRRCPRCKSRLVITDKIIQQATASVGGLAVRAYRCPVCGYNDEKRYRTRPIVRPPGSGPIAGGPGPFFGGFGGGRGSSGRGSFGPRGFGGGRSGGGGASRRW